MTDLLNASLSCQNELTPITKKTGRKRKFEGQNQVERKKLCNKNEQYFRKDGKLVEPKEFHHVTSCCNLNCCLLLDEATQHEIFNTFVTLGSFESRCVFIAQSVVLYEKKQELTTHVSRRTTSQRYILDNKKVCKKFYLRVLQINYNRVKIAVEKWKQGNIQDLRGKYQHLKDEHLYHDVFNHINQFERYESHYNRETSSNLFLSSSLSLQKLYLHYEESKTGGDRVASRSYYKKIFNSLGLKFKPLKTDTCKTCDILKYEKMSAEGNDSEIKVIEGKLETHQKFAKSLQDQMRLDFEASTRDNELLTLAFDLQKVLPLPRITTSVAFYSRNLSMYNLGVHNAKTNSAQFHTWTENEAGRGPLEIASCLIQFLKENVQQELKKLILWCDCCSGQNRNQILPMMLHHYLSMQSNIDEISIRFLCPGHTYMSCDRDFGLIEKKIKQEERIFLRQEYESLIEAACKGNRFKVKRMAPESFLSIEPVMKLVTKRDKDIQTLTKVSFLETHQIRIERSKPFILHVKYDIGCDEVI